MLELRCPLCATETAFEQPPCVDGHGVDCAEWACTVCGLALLIAPWDLPCDPGARELHAA